MAKNSGAKRGSSHAHTFLAAAVCVAAVYTSAGFAQSVAAELDVRPDDPANYIDIRTPDKSVRVAVLTTSVAAGDTFDFDATRIDPDSVRFGGLAAPPDPNYLALASRDVDADGDQDLELVFPIQAAGLTCNDESVTLSGNLMGGTGFSGSDLLTTSDCPSCHNLYDSQREAGDEWFYVDEDQELIISDAASSGQAEVVALPGSGELQLAPDGSFSYRPEADYNGLDEFRYWDGSGVRAVNLSVYPVDDPAVAQDDFVSAGVGFQSARAAPGLLANDADIEDDELSAVLVEDVSHGDLQLHPDGSFEYVPGPSFSGQDSFRYKAVSAGAESAPAEVHIGLPNILLILSDDVGLGDALIYNPGSGIGLPAIDALAAAGVRFDRAHSSSSACSPTRYSLLTGNNSYRSPRSNGVWGTIDATTMITPGEYTLGHLFSAAGYNNAFIGKMHNGAAFWRSDGSGYATGFPEVDFTRPFDKGPTQFGFDYSFVLPAGLSRGPYAFFENDRLVRFDPVTGVFGGFDDNEMAHSHFIPVTTGQSFNGGEIGNGGNAIDNYDSRKVDSILTNKALTFIDEHLAANGGIADGQPFFLYMALPAVHKPNTPPPYFNAADPQLIDNPAQGTPVANVTPVSKRTDMVYEADVVLDTLTARLAAEGILQDTLIIFTSDNGMSEVLPAGYNGIGQRIDTGRNGAQHINPQGVENGVPLRGYKLYVFEGGHRVPLIVRWGDGTAASSTIPPGTVTGQLVGLHDIMATLAELTAQPLGNAEGRDSVSFLPLLSNPVGQQTQVRDHLIVQGGALFAHETDGVWDEVSRAFYQRDSNGDQWKLIVFSDMDDYQLDVRAAALFNLSDDPGETQDLIGDPLAQPQLQAMFSAYVQLIGQDRTAAPSP